eukprot:GHRR01009765.1.p2 GENE.GHRR01009765.1~~GHRR01009765.1.p2  ORF type:complete len:354 (-),score=156.76 GHRR01009765.1:1631-2581(-)
MPKPQVVLVGATVSSEDIKLALDRGWISEPVVVRVGAAGQVPAGLKHKAIVVSGVERRLGGLVIGLRQDLADALEAADAAAVGADDSASATTGSAVQPAAANSSSSEAASNVSSSDAGSHGGSVPGTKAAAPVRVIIFAPSELEAKAAAEPLRSALWGDHMLSVLLPSTGAEPIKALHAFRDRVASLLLATPSAARGLDLPAVSHVNSLGLPQDATEYVHRAGRAGRIGSTEGGEVCTIITREELPKLQQMVVDGLGLELECVDVDKDGLGLLGHDWASAKDDLLGQEGANEQQQEENGSKLETARRGLEDLFNLL